MTNDLDKNIKTSSDSSSEEKPKLKPCCACPETRKARDMCMVERGEEECGDLIAAHRECMLKLGFKI